MIFAFIAFVLVDIFFSLKLRRFLMQKDFIWPGAISNFLYHSVVGTMYLDTAVYKNFLLTIDVTELYSTFRPASFAICFFMVFFHSWAFTGGHKERP